MYSPEDIQNILDELYDELPAEIYEGLNGGISVLDGYKHNSKIPSENYWVMGEYITDPSLGARIVIYYGSLMALYVDDGPEHLKTVLRKILRHELRHHVETKAGIKDLELEDEAFVEKALHDLGFR